MSTTSSAASRSLLAVERLCSRFRLCRRVAPRRGARRARVRFPAHVPAGIFPDPAGRSRRGLFRPSHQADDRDRRLCRHPLPGRRALPQTGRHLLAAGGGGEYGERARRSKRARDDLALPRAVADRRRRRGAGDLLVRARLRQPARRGAGRPDDVGLGDPRRRSASRQDRRHAAVHGRRRHGRSGARLSRVAPQ